MNRKKKVGLWLSILFVVAGFACITVTVTLTTKPATTAEAADETDSADHRLSKGDKSAAKGLIGETVSREEIEERVGKWEKFEMDGNGCERGVYAGKFYYENFML